MTLRIITILTLAVLLTSCELFVIGKRQTVVHIDKNQESPVGVVFLWKAELDSNNLTAVTELMRHPSGRQYLALERYELADDIRHWYNIIGGKPITSTVIDTVSAEQHVIHAKIDYIKDVTFSTVKVEEDGWFVSRIQ